MLAGTVSDRPASVDGIDDAFAFTRLAGRVLL
jgi:hypothetical protein